jgi:hypothetical protein
MSIASSGMTEEQAVGRDRNPRLRGFVIKSSFSLQPAGAGVPQSSSRSSLIVGSATFYGKFHADSFRSDERSILSIRRVAPSPISAFYCCIAKSGFLCRCSPLTPNSSKRRPNKLHVKRPHFADQENGANHGSAAAL